MSLPYSRNETYTLGVTQVKSQTQNDMQDLIVEKRSQDVGGQMLFSDDFMGSVADPSLWAPQNATLLYLDLTNGRNGVAKLDPTISGAGSMITAAVMALGTADFAFSFIARFPNYATALAMDTVLGLFNGVTPADHAYFRVTRTIGATQNVQAHVNVTDNNTGVAVPIGSFAKFEIRRVGTVLSFLINDVVVYTQSSYTNNIAYNYFYLSTTTNASSGIMYLDKAAGLVKLAR